MSDVKPAGRARRIAAMLVDLAVAAPPGALAGASIAAALASLPVAGSTALTVAGAWTSWTAYRAATDRRGRGVGRWLTGTRLVAADGSAPTARAAALKAATGVGLVVASAESLALGERAGGAIGRNKSWLAISAASLAVLGVFGGLLLSRIHLGADRFAWKRFHHAHHELACCAGSELPRAWQTCARRIEGALAVRAHGHSDDSVLTGNLSSLGPLVDACPARPFIELTGDAPIATLAGELGRALDATGETRDRAARFIAEGHGTMWALPGGDALLIRALQDRDPGVVAAAAEAAQIRGVPIHAEYGPSLIAALKGAPSHLRSPILRALGSVKSAESISALRDALANDRGDARLAAAESLLRLDPNDADASDVLAAALFASTPDSPAALDMYRRLTPRPSRVTDALTKALDDPDPTIRSRAKTLLAEAR